MVAFFMDFIQTKKYKFIELLLLFVIVPTFLVLQVVTWVKVLLVLLAIVYVVILSVKLNFFQTKIEFEIPQKNFWIRFFIISLIIFTAGFFLVKNIDATLLFKIVKTKPLLWLMILFVYSFLSVIPQELLYRGYFFKRYGNVFSNKLLLNIFNVFCFSYCHLFLKNYLVLIITAIGGLFFVYTYNKDKNILAVIVEHSVYGNLIFTLGLGEMLAFPA